jgi:ArsR family transcriptional regulator, lead/cadmium/zinc/bismuth-responsive transcriptional repressor
MPSDRNPTSRRTAGAGRLAGSALPDPAAIEQAARLFRAIGDEARLRLLVRVATGTLDVSELAAAERETLSTISQRLRVLRAENLLVRRRDGRHIIYALADDHVIDIVRSALAHAEEDRPASAICSSPPQEPQ